MISKSLAVWLILTFFGLATVVGGKMSVLRAHLGHRLYVLAGAVAALSWGLMGVWHSPVLLSLSLAGFGFGFIAIQPTLVGTAQQSLRRRRGTAMSLASFAMLTGGGLGTALNGVALRAWGFAAIFAFSATLILIAGALTSWVVRTLERERCMHGSPAEARGAAEVHQLMASH